jgi:hypothetical protein
MKHEHVYKINHQKILDVLATLRQNRIHDGRMEASGFTNVCQRKKTAGRSAERYFHCTGLHLEAMHSFDEQTHSKIVERRRIQQK